MIYSGPGGIPYAAIGMISIAAGVFSYVTYVDYKNESEEEAAKLAEAEQSDGMFASIFGENKNADDETLGTDENNLGDGTTENQTPGEEVVTNENNLGDGTTENQPAGEEVGTTENKTSTEPGEEFKLGGRNKKRKSKRKSVRFAKNSKKNRTRGKSTQN